MATFRTLEQIGGHPALDFCNTVKFRGQVDPEDKLVDFEALLEWCLLSGIVSKAQASALKKSTSDQRSLALRDAIALREAFREVLLFKGKTPVESLKRLERWIADLRPTPRIDAQRRSLTYELPVRKPIDVLHKIVASIADLLAQTGNLNLKSCDAADCDWVFIDETSAQIRRWCDDRTCGNADRARRFRLRKAHALTPAS